MDGRMWLIWRTLAFRGLYTVKHIRNEPVGRVDIVGRLHIASCVRGCTVRIDSGLRQVGKCSETGVIPVCDSLSAWIVRCTRVTEYTQIVEGAQIFRQVGRHSAKVAFAPVRVELLGVGQELVPEMRPYAGDVA